MKYLLPFVLATGPLLITACHPGNSSNPSATQKGGADSLQRSFFPVSDYLKGEIAKVDSTPLAIVKYVSVNKRTDSSFISPQVFHRLAVAFLAPELDSAVFNKEYKESSFVDETTKSLTFTYSTDNKTLALQRVDVRARHSENGSEKISGIYLEEQENRGDTAIAKKMYWQSGKQFQVVTLIHPKGQESRNEQLKVVWDQGE